MNISLIAALSKNFIIGRNNTIPWFLPEDLKWFKQHTINKHIIMGRVTWESLNKPLKNRVNIVISKKKIIKKNVIWVDSITAALNVAKKSKEIMIIGGAQIYQQMLFYSNKLYLTHVDAEINGDTYFPQYSLHANWNILFQKKCYKNRKHSYNYCFEILSKS